MCHSPVCAKKKFGTNAYTLEPFHVCIFTWIEALAVLAALCAISGFFFSCAPSAFVTNASVSLFSRNSSPSFPKKHDYALISFAGNACSFSVFHSVFSLFFAP